MTQRPAGAVHPGWRWGPFTARLPLVHLRPEPPELIQGLLVGGATGLAVVPLYAEHFGMGFETAIAFLVVQTLWIAAAVQLFGDPFCPGWLTPALPLVLAEAARFNAGEARTEFVNAVVLATGLLFVALGASGIGRLLMRRLPRAVKAAIVLGAGVSAVAGEFLPRSGGRPPRLEQYPWAIAAATLVTLALLYAAPLESARRRGWLGRVAALGLAPGFILALIVGPLAGEWDYGAFLAYAGPLLAWPDFGGLAAEFSVLGRGLPPAEMFLQAAPLALAAYVIGFSDMVTGTAIVAEATPHRPDERVPFDERRTHLSVGLRNVGVALTGGPFFPLQGPLWAGAMVVVAERYRRGRAAMDSLFSGVASYYLFGLPLVYFIRPLLEFLRPALDVAFSLTLLLTGYACASAAMGMVRERSERGVAFLGAMTIVYASLWAGLLAALALTALLIGSSAWRSADADAD